MEKKKVRVEFGPYQYFVDYEKGEFKKDEAMKLSGLYAGMCYDKEGLDHLMQEPEFKTINRVNNNKVNAHHSVFDHVNVNLWLQNIPKILAMVLNNEHQYNTSEKSARYTPVIVEDDSIITGEEERLYNKWMEIFKIRINEQYGETFERMYGEKGKNSKIVKLAQENARYLVTVFMPTQMIYSVPVAQINRIAAWCKKYIKTADMNDYFESNLALSMQELVDEFERLNLLDPGLMKNEKDRSFSLFGSDLDKVEEHFGDAYSTTYKGTFAQYAQAHRHRTLNYQLEILDDKEYFIPPIIEDDPMLVDEWLRDMKVVRDVYPQGEMVLISEMGTYDNFILKCQERLCAAAQLEIMRQTRETLLKYEEALKANGHYKAEDIKKYTRGARCTFPNFSCPSNCGFKEGINLSRKI